MLINQLNSFSCLLGFEKYELVSFQREYFSVFLRVKGLASWLSSTVTSDMQPQIIISAFGKFHACILMIRLLNQNVYFTFYQDIFPILKFFNAVI